MSNRSSMQHGTCTLIRTVMLPMTHPPKEQATQARWATPEYIFYYVCFVIVVSTMVWIPASLSSRTSAIFTPVIHNSHTATQRRIETTPCTATDCLMGGFGDEKLYVLIQL